jgi:uncharacterized SAM-binding protein YcdF (DUF218 family)
MYFVLSKTVGALLTPSILISSIALAGLIMVALRFSIIGRRLLLASTILLVICTLTPLGFWLLVPLEERFPGWNSQQGDPTGIIVLGGSIDPELSAARGFAVFPAGADRLIAAAELARRYPKIPVIFTGGSAALVFGDAREADFVLNMFQRLGLPKEQVILERESRNTMENAAFTKALAAPRPGDRWLLVTSAYHMPRSVGLFRNSGFSVQPYPVDWLTPGGFRWFWIDRPLNALLRTDLAVREWIGLFADWVMGKSPELFPKPTAQP